VTVLLEDGACKVSAAHDENLFIVLFEFLDQGNKVTITAHNHKSIDVIARKCHLQRIQRKVDVGAIFVASRCQVALPHLNGVLSHAAAVLAGALPVSVGDFGYHLTALFDCFENRSDVEVPIESAFDPDFNIVKVYEYSDL